MGMKKETGRQNGVARMTNKTISQAVMRLPWRSCGRPVTSSIAGADCRIFARVAAGGDDGT